MDLEEYYTQEEIKQEELMFRSFQTEYSFYKHLLLVASSILGILISLHQTGSSPLYARVTFFLAVVLLTLGILALSVVVYDYTKTLKDFYRTYRTGLRIAKSLGNTIPPFAYYTSRKTKFFVRFSYGSLLIALVLLIIYTFLCTFT